MKNIIFLIYPEKFKIVFESVSWDQEKLFDVNPEIENLVALCLQEVQSAP
jgi:hypothetical protein